MGALCPAFQARLGGFRCNRRRYREGGCKRRARAARGGATDDRRPVGPAGSLVDRFWPHLQCGIARRAPIRLEERRVGQEGVRTCRTRRSPTNSKNKILTPIE